MTTLNLSNKELEKASDISEADIILSVALWKRYAPAQYRTIIDTDDKVFEWVKSEMVYKRNGVRIDPTRLRTLAIDPFLSNVKLAMRGLSTQLQSGALKLPEWQQQMNDLIKWSQLAAALVANGGTRNSTQNDYAVVAISIFAMLTFLQVFANEIESGKQKLNGSILSRSGLYANAARDAYEETRRIGMARYAGATLERRVLDAVANHCVTDGEMIGCVELAAMGWQPIGTLPRLYDTPCRTNCMCHFEFS